MFRLGADATVRGEAVVLATKTRSSNGAIADAPCQSADLAVATLGNGHAIAQCLVDGAVSQLTGSKFERRIDIVFLGPSSERPDRLARFERNVTKASQPVGAGTREHALFAWSVEGGDAELAWIDAP